MHHASQGRDYFTGQLKEATPQYAAGSEVTSRRGRAYESSALQTVQRMARTEIFALTMNAYQQQILREYPGAIPANLKYPTPVYRRLGD